MIHLGIFESWKKNIQESLGKSRFLAKSRQEALEDLVYMLVEENIPYDDAERLKNNLKNCLVTKKGLSGSGNHKGWKEAVESDFLRILYEVYKEKNLLPLVETPNPQQNASNVNSERLAMVEKNELIEIWGKSKFQGLWGESLSMAANTPDTSLHNLFLDEFFG